MFEIALKSGNLNYDLDINYLIAPLKAMRRIIMNNENLKNVLIIDRVSKEVTNEPEIEIDEKIYEDAVSKLVAELLLSLKRGIDMKNLEPRGVFSWKKKD